MIINTIISGGTAPAPVLTTKTITENGTYNASTDGADGYSSVSVNVSGGGGGVVTRLVSVSGNPAYYTTASMVATSSHNPQGVLMPVGSIIFCNSMAEPGIPISGVELLASYSRGSYRVYKVIE